jgi:hypothetical protein
VGTYSTNFKFYKPDASEFVDPVSQLNRNWDIADEAVRRLCEWEFTPLAYPDMSQARTTRAKFYRQYSNSMVTYFKSSNLWYQDPKSFVAAFTQRGSDFSEGYNFFPVNFDISARLVKNSGGSTAEVEWAGAFWELGGNMELNTNVTVINSGVIPAELRPASTKYFHVWAGNTTSDFSIARLFFGSDGSLQFKRYGANPGAPSAENRVEFTGCTFNVEVTGT